MRILALILTTFSLTVPVEAADGDLIGDFVDMVSTKSPVDLVLVMDRSLGIGISNYYIDFFELVQNVLKHYVYIHPDYVRIAAVTFGKNVKTPFEFISEDFKTKAEVLGGPHPPIDLMEFYNDRENGAGTNIIDGLDEASRILALGRGTRRKVEQVILLVTDGEYNTDEDPFNQANKLKDRENVTIFCLGIGSYLTPGNVRTLASKGEYFGEAKLWEELLKGRPYPVDADAPLEFSVINATYCVQNTTEHSTCVEEIMHGFTKVVCNPGYYRNGDSCTECPRGTYKSVYGEDTCTPCPLASDTPNTANTDASSCTCQPDCGPCDANSCTSSSHEVCVADDQASHHCDCAPGYQRINGSGSECENIDDCQDNKGCQNDGTCYDGLSGYYCLCEYGFRGERCEIDIDECKYDICVNGTCLTTDRGDRFECECFQYWVGRTCNEYVPPTTTTPTTTTTSRITTTTTPTTTTTRQTPGPTEKLKEEENDNMIIIIGAAAGGGFLLIIIVVLVLCLVVRRRRRRKQPPPNMESSENIAHKFSGIWKKKTIRGKGVGNPLLYNSVGPRSGLPTVPPRRRPDLLSSSNTLEAGNAVDELFMNQQAVKEMDPMEGWAKYLSELKASGIIVDGCISKLDGVQYAKTEDWRLELDELTRIEIIMEGQDINVPVNVQGGEFYIRENDGVCATAHIIDSMMAPHLVEVSKTSNYIVVAIGARTSDQGRCKREVLWIADHIRNEGY